MYVFQFARMAIFSRDEKGKIKPINYNSFLYNLPDGSVQHADATNTFICNLLLVVSEVHEHFGEA